jgi:hypothetical protein
MNSISSGIMTSFCILYVEYMYRTDWTGKIADIFLVQLDFQRVLGTLNEILSTDNFVSGIE